MEHVGDITQLHGAELPPVDIITFGSPCQGLSAAGKRKGLADPRSGLFMEAIRIIQEMREATNGQYPTFALWENVPGAMHSNSGLDFKAVLEAFTEAEIPLPRSGKWANAGMVRGDGIDLAWCVYNAQYFGTAQRRRRIFLVSDFRGERAGEILFVPKSLRGYFEAGGTPRQGAAAYALRGADSATEGGTLNPWDTQQSRISTEDGVSPTLAGTDGGGGRNPAGLVYAAFHGGAGANARSIGYSEKVSPTLKAGASGFHSPCLCEPKLARTLTARGDSSPCVDRGQNVITIACEETEELICAATGQTGAEILDNCAPTLTCRHEQPILYKALGVHQNHDGDLATSPTAYTLATNGNASGRNAPLVMASQQGGAGMSGNNQPVLVHPEVSGTLCASAAGLSRPAGMASETDLCVAYCLIGRKDENGPRGSGVQNDLSFTLTATDTPAVAKNIAIPINDKATRYKGGALTRKGDGSGNGLGVGKNGDPSPTLTAGDRHAVAVDCRNFREIPELSGTLQSKENGSYSLNYQNPLRLGYIVRRLTPIECERLMGFPDNWTALGHDGKKMSDSARYMMLGNSVAVPCVAYIMQSIAEQLNMN